jgi:hypothetical protein
LYTNHGLVLMRIAVNPDVTLSQLALDIGIRERAAYLIVRDLAKEGFIEKQKVGRRNYYRVNVDRVLDYEPLPGLTVRQQITAMAGTLGFPERADEEPSERQPEPVGTTATPGS